MLPKPPTRIRSSRFPVAMLAALLLGVGPAARGVTILHQDGRSLEAIRIAEVTGIAEDPNNPKALAGEVAVAPILLLDDGLRRTYIGQHQVRQVLEADPQRPVKIRLWQNVAEHGGAVGRVGRALNVTPFDEFGRRIYEMQGPGGALAVVQGITEVTATYTRVQGLIGQPRPIVWDMRIATSSIPRNQLGRILQKAVSPDDLDQRLQVVRLFLQAGWFREAGRSLEQIARDFPEAGGAKRAAFDAELRQLRQLGAGAILDEIQLRSKAGQHQRAAHWLASFPTEGVAGETLQEVREILTASEQTRDRIAAVGLSLAAALEGVTEPVHHQLAKLVVDEIRQELTPNTLDRLEAYIRLADDPSLSGEQKVALALSGWIVGSSDATDNFAVASSLFELRKSVRQYLLTAQQVDRLPILTTIRDLEGGTPQRVAQILAMMKPPRELAATSLRGPGCHELSVEVGPNSPPVRYLVQLPPEYDPLRKYPTVVALCGLDATPELELDFWAGGAHPEQGRMGQAARHGFITLAVEWQVPHQSRYNSSMEEHRAVLLALRDALTCCSIDTDRVFLTGHDLGGEAAWDIGLAHPDLWAGVIPMLTAPPNYGSRYRANAQLVDWYVVFGELDGGKVAASAAELDRYLRPKHSATVVEYEGRGLEGFSDEIQRLFDWMNRRQRRLPTDEFEIATMRPWDTFFWWLEIAEIPERHLVAPGNWPPDRGTRALPIRARRLPGNKLSATARTGQVTVWLNPDWIDFSQPMEIEINGRNLIKGRRLVEPSLEVLLEDARTRCDRQRPFWAKVESE